MSLLAAEIEFIKFIMCFWKVTTIELFNLTQNVNLSLLR